MSLQRVFCILLLSASLSGTMAFVPLGLGVGSQRSIVQSRTAGLRRYEGEMPGLDAVDVSGLSQTGLQPFDTSSVNWGDFLTPINALIPLGVLGLVKLTSYWKIQYETAEMLGGIPSKSKVLELDAKDGKNIFYMPKGVDFTAVMSPGDDPEKQKDKNQLNERLILECIGNANRGGMELSGKVRMRTQEVASRTVDCVISTGALARSPNSVETVLEVYRMLRPGGLFVFIEPDGGDSVVSTIGKEFPARIVGTASAGEKQRKVQAAREAEEAEGPKGKKKAKKSKKAKKGMESAVKVDVLHSRNEATGDGAAALETQQVVDSIADTSSATESSGLAEQDTEKGAPVAEEEAGSAKRAQEGRPGITYERIRMGFDMYTVGIAVRP